jgi:hypothetical protein
MIDLFIFVISAIFGLLAMIGAAVTFLAIVLSVIEFVADRKQKKEYEINERDKESKVE